jgi:DNA-binding response OmpR family regulator
VLAPAGASSPATAPLIVVVEDDALILKMLRYYLLSMGYHVVTWTRATGAASLIAREQPALVLLDMRMERDRAGLDVLRAMRMRRESETIPVLFVSAWADDLTTDERDEIHAAHAEAMMKPFDFADLIDRMRRMMAPDT